MGRHRPFSRWRPSYWRYTLVGMTKPPTPTVSKRVSIEVAQRNGRIVCDYIVWDAWVAGTKQTFKHRRVYIHFGAEASIPQLTLFAKRMAEFVTAKVGPGHQVPQGLPWFEVGQAAPAAVPPARGGRGGHNPGEESAERGIPKTPDGIYHQSTPSSAGDQRVARHSSSALDLPDGWSEQTLPIDQVDKP